MTFLKSAYVPKIKQKVEHGDLDALPEERCDDKLLCEFLESWLRLLGTKGRSSHRLSDSCSRYYGHAEKFAAEIPSRGSCFSILTGSAIHGFVYESVTPSKGSPII
uniref:Uncharacterized protein n=1 Tax=Cannabis sativa TaxID=3483 RepID=A0A803PYL5_CANSA